MDNNLLQFTEMFVIESNEILEDMESRLLNLQPGASDKEELNAIFRCAHTIKGTAGAIGFEHITKFTHKAETLLDLMREGKLDVTPEIIEVLLSSRDILQKFIDGIKNNVPADPDFGKEVSDKLSSILDGKTPQATVTATEQNDESESGNYHIIFKPKNEIFIFGNEPLLVNRELAKLGKLDIKVIHEEIPGFEDMVPTYCYMSWELNLQTEKSLDEIKQVFEFVESESFIKITPVEDLGENLVNTEHEDEAKQDNDQNKANIAKKSSTTSIRVDTDKVDKLVNMVGELVITQSMLYAKTAQLPSEQYQDLMQGIDDLFNHSRALQEAVMSIRMQAVKSIFTRFPRIVRDLSSQLGKKIKLNTSGENTEVDKTVIELISDPLTHMIRNCVDHGIELPDERIANGKNPEGTVVLEAYQAGGKIIIRISDDGAGINREKVLSKAKNKKLIAEDAVLTDSEIDELIFLPGLSTADKVTDISGRGVGMDVVKRNIESLGGSVEIDNKPGLGTRMSLFLPLTLAILDGMVVRTGNQSYIIPIASIIETLHVKNEEIKKLSHTEEVINIRGEFIRIIYLHKIFNIQTKLSNTNKSLIILLENNNSKYGLAVEELIGQQQVVIKSIEENTGAIEGISGATILGDGNVSFILDTAKLEQMDNKTDNQLFEINS